jgi:TonB family protein
MSRRSLCWSVIVAGFFIILFTSSSLAQSEPLQETPSAAKPANVDAGKLEVYKPGKDGVSTPVLVYSEDPKIPKAARKASLFGTVVVKCYVEPDGTTSNVHVVQTVMDEHGDRDGSVAKALGDSAIDAVQQYKFKPSKKDGKPVRIELKVEVHFVN